MLDPKLIDTWIRGALRRGFLGAAPSYVVPLTSAPAPHFKAPERPTVLADDLGYGLGTDPCILCGHHAPRADRWVYAQTWTSIGRTHLECVVDHRQACLSAVLVMQGQMTEADAAGQFRGTPDLWRHVWERREFIKALFLEYGWASASEFQ